MAGGDGYQIGLQRHINYISRIKLKRSLFVGRENDRRVERALLIGFRVGAEVNSGKLLWIGVAIGGRVCVRLPGPLSFPPE